MARSSNSTRSHKKCASTVCEYRVSGSISLPSRGSCHLSLTVLCAIGHRVVFSLGGWSLLLPTGFHVSRGTLDHTSSFLVSTTGLLPSMAELSNSLHLRYCIHVVCPQPLRSELLRFGLFRGRSPLLAESNFFLLLRVLRCFSSPGSPR